MVCPGKRPATLPPLSLGAKPACVPSSFAIELFAHQCVGLSDALLVVEEKSAFRRVRNMPGVTRVLPGLVLRRGAEGT